VGPGAYNANANVKFASERGDPKSGTAAFLSTRPDDVFGINKSQPGPQDYFKKG